MPITRRSEKLAVHRRARLKASGGRQLLALIAYGFELIYADFISDGPKFRVRARLRAISNRRWRT